MRYIGNKSNLLEFIYSIVKENNLPKGSFCDIFSGTTSVARFFKSKGFRVLSNDFMTYSYVFQKAYIENNKIPTFKGLEKIIPAPDIFKVINFLNNLEGKEGFIFKNYCIEGSKKYAKYERNYFSSENAKKIDVIRDEIEEWKNKNLVTESEFYILVASLLEEVPYVSNIAGTYGCFLKSNDPRMFKPLLLKVPTLLESDIRHYCYKEDSNKLIRRIFCDILYIDPPYNNRQYAPNYHIFESIAIWDKQITDTRTGLRPYKNQRSLYCYDDKCITIFDDLITNAKCKFILFSYNTEGIIPHKEVIRILSKKGKLKVFSYDYKRFKSNSNGKKKKEPLKELIYSVEVPNKS